MKPTNLLLRVQIPMTFKYGKNKSRKLLLNHVLTMHHFTRLQHHDTMLTEYKRIIKDAYNANGWPYCKGDTYTVSLGFKRSKSTRTCDLDGFGYLMKIAIDALIECTPIPNDNFNYITETRTVYLGREIEEQLWLQVTKN